MPSPTRMVDWRAAADPEDLREYDRFGPWIDAVTTLSDMPRRFRPWYSELSGATYLIKVPRNIDRAAARPGMDLYSVVLAVFPDWLCLLRLDVGGVTRTDLPAEQVVATNVHTNLLIGRWSLLLADGSSIDLEYNTVSQERIAEVDRYLRRRPATDESSACLLPAVHAIDHVHEVVVIVPIDAHVNEAEDVAQEHGCKRRQVLPIGAVRHLQFQHHDGDDDGQHPVAEGFQAVRSHGGKVGSFPVAHRWPSHLRQIRSTSPASSRPSSARFTAWSRGPSRGKAKP